MSDALVAAFRHDAHKFTGESHADASPTVAGVPVNKPVPDGADADAAALSRPPQSPRQTVPTHTSHHRLSLLTGDTVSDTHQLASPAIDRQVQALIAIDDAETAHARWLNSDVAAAFNESVYYPYTSLKYHTLLVAALLDTYQAGNDFADLRLIVDPAHERHPCRTVFSSERFALRISGETTDRPAARLGRRPSRSWASTWTRLTAHPLETDHDRYDMTLDANLRRIRSWSTALQYIEDFEQWRCRPHESPEDTEASAPEMGTAHEGAN